MNMLDLPADLLRHEFVDVTATTTETYSYVGRWLADDKYCYENLVGFLRANKIAFSFCSLHNFPHRFGIKVYPKDIEEANKLFYSPWRNKLFILENRR